MEEKGCNIYQNTEGDPSISMEQIDMLDEYIADLPNDPPKIAAALRKFRRNDPHKKRPANIVTSLLPIICKL